MGAGDRGDSLQKLPINQLLRLSAFNPLLPEAKAYPLDSRRPRGPQGQVPLFTIPGISEQHPPHTHTHTYPHPKSSNLARALRVPCQNSGHPTAERGDLILRTPMGPPRSPSLPSAPGHQNILLPQLLALREGLPEGSPFPSSALPGFARLKSTCTPGSPGLGGVAPVQSGPSGLPQPEGVNVGRCEILPAWYHRGGLCRLC